jgi:hypothetical protein
MSLSRDSRQERKLKAFRRAEFQLKQRLERIDWEEDVLIPEIQALKSDASVLGLPAGSSFDITIENVDQNHSTPAAPTDTRANIQRADN